MMPRTSVLLPRVNSKSLFGPARNSIMAGPRLLRQPRSLAWAAGALAALLAAGSLHGEPVVLDDCARPQDWKVVASDGVVAEVSAVPGLDGPGLRLHFEFKAGSGFCALRRPVALPLPGNYRFSFALCGPAPTNNLEFKLIDESGQNVWWVNRRGFEFPTTWTTIHYRAREFSFAWGPAAGLPLEKMGFIELVVAAGSGGKGSVCFDSLTFEELPPAQDLPDRLTARPSSDASGPVQTLSLSAEGALAWHSDPDDTTPALDIDLAASGEVGGLIIDWDPVDYATDYAVFTAFAPDKWERVARVRGSNGGRDFVPTPGAEGRLLRLVASHTSRGQGVGLRRVRTQGPFFATSLNALLQVIGRESPLGRYPRWTRREQTPWTIVGVAADSREALFSAAGQLEVDKLTFSFEPFIHIDGRLLTWTDVERTQSLVEDYLPVPSVHWQAENLALNITASADGPPGHSTLIARYVLHNAGAARRQGKFYVALRPLQVLPPWQDLNITGGAAPISRIRLADGRVLVDEVKAVQPWTPPDGFGATTFAAGDISEYLARAALPRTVAVEDPQKLASAALAWAFDLEPGQSRTVVLSVPFHGLTAELEGLPPGGFRDEADAARCCAALVERVCAGWRAELNRVQLVVPPQADKLANTFRTMQAYVLINADGPAIQPGSRSYERSWIRDGAMTSGALLGTGHAERVRAFLDWYAPYQYPSGKVPCVVDTRGPDPVPENDSHGELIYALHKFYRFTRDRDFLERHLPRVIAAVDYMEEIRNQRMTPEYRDGSPEMRACYGLLPESISHEGYSAKPMHSYWDDFYALKGLKDATSIAVILGRTDLAARFGALRDSFAETLYASVRQVMANKSIDYIPGCAELGDFDATSTTIGVFPCGELGRIPEPQLTNTFARYWDFFTQRRSGALDWDNYTPYELRTVGTFLRLDQPQRVHALLDFFIQHQSPLGWNQWAEVVSRDPLAPRFIGDMPHTWVGSDYINAIRNLFVYEREADDALVLAAGVAPDWVSAGPGLTVGRFPTEYGLISYTYRTVDGRLTLEVDGQLDPTPARIIIKSALDRPLSAVRLNGQPHADFSAREVVVTGLPARVEME